MMFAWFLHDKMRFKLKSDRVAISRTIWNPKKMKSTDVYVYQGISSVQASPDQIRRVIKYPKSDVCLEQEFIFEAAKAKF